MPLLLFLLAFLLPGPRAEPGIPPELRPWVPWVLEAQPQRDCPVLEAPLCLWPGLLRLEVGEGGGSFALDFRADAEVDLELPGGEACWPEDVRLDGRPVPVLAREGHPWLRVSPGEHRLDGRFRWSLRPHALPVPPNVARVSLRLDGQEVPFPRLEEGRLLLGRGGEEGEGSLELVVSRRVEDGVPVLVRTHLELRASGRARELDLGEVLVPGTRPVALSGELPARFRDGHLLVQLRAGSFGLDFAAVHEGPVSELRPPEPGPPWPERETWVVALDERFRSVELSGPPAVDPSRTELPDDWRGLPTFLLAPGEALSFRELRRGEEEPPPDDLHLRRELWLDQDGRGLTVLDRFSGSLHRHWRLDARPPLRLQRVEDHGEGRVLTRGSGGAVGVELRRPELELRAESRIEDFRGELPAVGWSQGVQELSATLHLPPGWSLLAASGVDRAPGSLLAQWDVYDLFSVLVLAFAAGRLFGWGWGLLALLALLLSWHAEDAPRWSWAALLAFEALHRLARGRLRSAFRLLRGATGLLLVVLLLPFAVEQLQQGFFPALEQPWQQAGQEQAESWKAAPEEPVALARETAGLAEAPPLPAQAPPLLSSTVQAKAKLVPSAVASRSSSSSWKLESAEQENAKAGYLSLQYDPDAVVSTGQGLPAWEWEEQELEWSGPVPAGHGLRLYLFGPGWQLAGHLLRVLFLLALLLRVLGLRAWPRPGRLGAAAGGAALLLLPLLAPRDARAAPSQELLHELAERLSRPPSCRPDCLAVPRARLEVGEGFRLDAELDAGADTAWPLPGPPESWTPRTVLLDGVPCDDLLRRDGRLYLRVPEGVHRVLLEGPLPEQETLSLDFGLSPARLELASRGWEVAGVHRDGTVDAVLQLSRGGGGEGGGPGGELWPWLELRRFLDFGLPWRVRTELVRLGPSTEPLSMEVPLLPGETVTSPLEVVDGKVRVTLQGERRSISWLSSLEPSEVVRLEAPEAPWSEVWTVSCSPVFSCDFEGPPPVSRGEEHYAPEWHPWPGESLVIRVSRPEPVAGNAVTVDRVELDYEPGRRLAELTLRLSVRSSQGGQRVLRLPEGAELREVLVDGEPRPLRLQGRELSLPLQPGRQDFVLRWQQPHEPRLWDRLPGIELGPAVNATVNWHPQEGRWVLALLGPRWGPVPLFWTYVFLLLLAAPLLARLPTPLRGWQWFLLGLGMVQLPWASVLVALFPAALGARRRWPPARAWLYDLAQLGLVLLGVAAAVALWMGLRSGLVMEPDARIAGNASTNELFRWYVDRVEGELPRPAVLSLPLWAWRVFMLAWAAWLAASLLGWLPWAWRSWTEGGVLRSLKPRAGAE